MRRFAGDAMNPGAGLFSSASKSAPDFGNLSFTAMAEKSKEKQASMYSGAKVAGAGIESLGASLDAMNTGKAGIASAEAEASATRQNGMMSMFGDIAGAGIGAIGSKKTFGANDFDLNKNFW